MGCRPEMCMHARCNHVSEKSDHKNTTKDETMRRSTHVALLDILILAVTSLAVAQGVHQEIPVGVEPQPVQQLGNYIEVGNDVLMHLIATGDFRYQTTENFDFER